MQAGTDELFKALGDPTRRSLFERLVREGAQTVRALTDHAGISQPAVSKHLGVLKSAGLVRDHPEGRQTFYSAEPNGLAPLAGWMKRYGSFWLDRFDQLEDLLEEMD
jgi:DNA-binding transcriptional ArsR family regulator